MRTRTVHSSPVGRGLVLQLATVALLGANPAVASTLTVNPDAVAFSKVRVGSLAQISVNEIAGEATSSLLVTIDNDSDFSLFNVPTAVSANGSATFDVACTVAGAKSATITVSWTAPEGVLQIPVSCDAPAMWIDSPADPFNFMGQEVGTLSAAEFFTITNDWGAAALISDLLTGGSDCAEFVLGNVALPIALPANAGTMISIAFAPSFRGDHGCTLTVVDDIAGVADNTLGLTGFGEGASIELAPAGTLTFPDQQVDTSSIGQVLSISNNGDSGYDLDVTDIVTSGDAASDFTLTGFTSGVIVSGASADVHVTFTPGTEGVRNATLLINTSEPAGLSAAKEVTGTGVTDLELIFRSGFE